MSCGNSKQVGPLFPSAGARRNLLDVARSINITPLRGGRTWAEKACSENKKFDLCLTDYADLFKQQRNLLTPVL
jgi:hypothetical protein